MKKYSIIRILIAAVLVLVLSTSAVAFAETGEAEGSAILYSIQLQQESLQLYTGDTYQAQYAVALLTDVPATGEPAVYESSDPSVATVDEDGLITAVAKGECRVRISIANAETVSCKVKVRSTVPVEALSVKNTQYYIVFDAAQGTAQYWTGKQYKDGMPKLGVTLSPKKTTQTSLTYTSSDAATVAVDENGKLSILTLGGKDMHTVRITVASVSDPSLTQDVTLTIVSSESALKDPVCIEGEWMEKAFAPQVFKTDKAKIYIRYLTNVRGLDVYTEGKPIDAYVQRYISDLQVLPAAIVENRHVDRVIISSQKLYNFYDGMEHAVGVAVYGGGDNTIIVDGKYYDRYIMCHELLHMWDLVKMDGLSDAKQFKQMANAEYMALDSGWNIEWIKGQPEEFLAYAGSMYLAGDGQDRELVRRSMPGFQAFMDYYFNPAVLVADQAA